LLRLHHLQEVTEAKGEEMEIEAARFDSLRESSPRSYAVDGLFQTPPEIADKMVNALGGLSGRVLEPSAGLGRLYQAIRRESAAVDVVLVENNADLCGELWRLIDADMAARLVCDDFLKCGPDRLGGSFDCIVMNPPFRMGKDVTHIKWARSLLAPGGRLVSLCYAGARQRLAIEPIADTWELLPPGSFSSEGTRADVAMVTFSA